MKWFVGAIYYFLGDHIELDPKLPDCCPKEEDCGGCCCAKGCPKVDVPNVLGCVCVCVEPNEPCPNTGCGCPKVDVPNVLGCDCVCWPTLEKLLIPVF